MMLPLRPHGGDAPVTKARSLAVLNFRGAVQNNLPCSHSKSLIMAAPLCDLTEEGLRICYTHIVLSLQCLYLRLGGGATMSPTNRIEMATALACGFLD